MANKMLIDATHPEETRVVVVRGNRVEEFDFESANRRQLKGNIYLAKVTRVEPSLQAAFVDYGGNRHGFLAFSEIHPDYYQIPVADRQALIAEEERAQRAADAEIDRRAGRSRRPARAAGARLDEVRTAPAAPEETETASGEPRPAEESATGHGSESEAEPAAEPTQADEGERAPADELEALEEASEPALEIERAVASEQSAPAQPAAESAEGGNGGNDGNGGALDEIETEDDEAVESVGAGDAMEEVPERMPRGRRQYKIQEVIKRRQVMLVQVVKEERGTKGAALTTYLSLAGRYSVLMPNTARGGGISRKITDAQDRKRLKELAQDLEVPEGMGVILRTAGANRTKAEIKRDFEYLLRLWETVRDLTLKSTAPTLVYEEGSLIKRSIRDLYNKDIDEVLVAGEEAYREAKDFMRMLMPSHAKNVKPYKDGQPVFTRYGVESQLDAMFSPTVQLRSGGYIVLNQTEALVSIDVNSGRATREHHIEDTALKTNLEASEEIARQLRLRDLAGLIVIDFIDMDEKRNNRAVERRLKDCLKYDRARIQVGRVSHFGLLEMSRQRIRTSVLESSTEKCPHCGGTGHVRSVSSVTLQLLRTLDEMLIKAGTHNLIVRTRADVALYVLNHKRAHLRELEQRFHIAITVNADPSIGGQQPFVIERGEQVHSLEAAKAIAAQPTAVPVEEEEEELEAEPLSEDTVEEVQAAEPGEAPGRRRRRRRRGRHGGEPDLHQVAPAQAEPEEAEPEEAEPELEARQPDAGLPQTAAEAQAESERRRRRRGRRGGRRRRGREGEAREPETFEPQPTIEPELHVAVADFDRPPGTEPKRAAASVEPRRADEPAPEPSPPNEPPAQADQPQRRSTVREPAPFFAGQAPVQPSSAPAGETRAPEPEPAAPGPDRPAETESTDRPRRTGWWARRVAGKG
ncbi:MAG: Rne/Rng family ribonuclease [Alphaproteobacteria bacterium]|nr:MAG: Rne/Rng family ribonuclease [Alphaproteobacteria bacterium]